MRIRIEMNMSDLVKARQALSLGTPNRGEIPASATGEVSLLAQPITPSPFTSLLNQQHMNNAVGSIVTIANGLSQQMPATPIANAKFLRGARSIVLHPNGSHNWVEFLSTDYMNS